MDEKIMIALFPVDDEEYDVLRAYRKLRKFKDVPDVCLLFDQLCSLVDSSHSLKFD